MLNATVKCLKCGRFQRLYKVKSLAAKGVSAYDMCVSYKTYCSCSGQNALYFDTTVYSVDSMHLVEESYSQVYLLER